MDGVHRRALERVLMLAGRDRLLCVIHMQRDDGNRIVEPYKLYNSPTGGRLLHCFQVAGEEGSGWRSLALEDVERIMPLEVTFTPRGEYAMYDVEDEADADAPRLRLVR